MTPTKRADALIAKAKEDVLPAGLMTLQEAAAQARISLENLRTQIKNGDLEQRYIGHKPVVRVADFNKWVESLPEERPVS